MRRLNVEECEIYREDDAETLVCHEIHIPP